MNKDINELEDLTPEQARYKLAETKLKLLNALSHLEMLEKRMDHKRQQNSHQHSQQNTQLQTQQHTSAHEQANQ